MEYAGISERSTILRMALEQLVAIGAEKQAQPLDIAFGP